MSAPAPKAPPALAAGRTAAQPGGWPADQPGAEPAATAAPAKDLPPAAQRALAEAEERRRLARPQTLPPELGGRDGPEPVRYGDYEKDGRAVDF